jgi:hypothetical protein
MPSPLAADPIQTSPLAPQNAPPQPPMNLLQQAQQQYPVLQNQNYGYVENYQQGRGFLEHWAPGEPGAPDAPRPAQIPSNQYGLEIYDPKTRPIDVLGDVVSHQLVNTDPNIKNVYQQFQQSMTPQQHQMLAEQYQYAQQNEGEKRSFEQWKEQSGLPSFFRGYAFDQWPKEFNDKVYTPEQKQMFDGMMQYLRGGQ